MDFDLNSTVTTGVSSQKPTKGLINEYVLFPYFQPYSDVLMENQDTISKESRLDSVLSFFSLLAPGTPFACPPCRAGQVGIWKPIISLS